MRHGDLGRVRRVPWQRCPGAGPAERQSPPGCEPSPSSLPSWLPLPLHHLDCLPWHDVLNWYAKLVSYVPFLSLRRLGSIRRVDMHRHGYAQFCFTPE